MKWQELVVTTIETARDAVANLFYEVGAQGVVIEDPRDMARYLKEELWEYHEFPPESFIGEDVILKCYLPIDEKLPFRVEELRQSLNDLEQHFDGHRYELTVSEVAEEDWANAWKTYFKAEKVGERVVVVPSWEHYQPRQGEVPVLLDPGMAFGTGTHPTTAMCIRALEEYLRPGQKVIDVGTGSGILAITAALLGAAEVQAVDMDPLAVEVAAENVRINGLDSQVAVSSSDLLQEVKGQGDIITANIVAAVITRLAAQAAAHLRENGVFIASGIIRPRLAEVETAILAGGMCIIDVRQQGDWVSVVSIKEEAQ